MTKNYFIILLYLLNVTVINASFQEASESFEDSEDSLREESLRKIRHAKRVDAEKARAIAAAETAAANKFVDFALSALGNVLKGHNDTIQLPNTIRQVNKKVLFLPFRAHANFYEGKLKGLESIHRDGDAHMITETGTRGDETLSLVFDITLRDVQAQYGYKVSVMGVGPGGQVTGKLKSIKIHLILKMSPTGELTVDVFNVKDTGLFTVTMKGLGPFNYLFSGIGVIIGNLSKRLLLESLEDKLKALMNESLAGIATTRTQKRGLSFLMKSMLTPIDREEETTPKPHSHSAAFTADSASAEHELAVREINGNDDK